MTKSLPPNHNLTKTPILVGRTVFFAILVALLVAAVPPKENIRVFLVGDSLMATKIESAYPLTGWGQILGSYFKDNVSVHNLAQDGRTTRSFVNENRWRAVLDSLQHGDYVLIGFAHNDEKVNIPAIGVPLSDYTAFLTQFVKEAKQKNAIPILLTPVMRRNFVGGVLTDTHGVYADAVRQVAKNEKVNLIDLQRQTEHVISDLGEEGSKQFFNWVDSAAYKGYPKGSKDNTHLSINGARKVAELVTQNLRDLHMSLASYLK